MQRHTILLTQVKCPVWLAAAAILYAATPALAYDEPKLIEQFGDWGAWEQGEKKRHLCYASSVPKEVKGGNRTRGEPEALVTHHPGARVKDEVAFISGYLFRKGTQVEVKIGGNDFQLRTSRDGALPGRKGIAEKMLVAMKEGKTMIVSGVTAWGKSTSDTYSLVGFAEAYAAISKACGHGPKGEEGDKKTAGEEGKDGEKGEGKTAGEEKTAKKKSGKEPKDSKTPTVTTTKKTGDETARKALLLPPSDPKPKRSKIIPLR